MLTVAVKGGCTADFVLLECWSPLCEIVKVVAVVLALLVRRLLVSNSILFMFENVLPIVTYW